MARTGPQKIPGANLSLFFGGGRRYTGSGMEVNCGVLHTTEGATLYDYGGGAEAPTVTAVPDFGRQQLVWYQHFDVDESARALVNAPGGVQTNTANVFQIELVGTCDPSTHAAWTRRGIDHSYWPEPPDWAVRDLAWLMRWLRDEHGIPLMSGLEWLPYPASYGASRARLTFTQWTNFRGWCGHQHVPENDHGDPGNLPIDRILAAAAGEPSSPSASGPDSVQEDDMPPQELMQYRIGPQYAEGGYEPTVADCLHGAAYATQRAEEALAAIAQLRADLPQLLLNAPMPDYAVLPNGYRPTVGEALNGGKGADDLLAAQSAVIKGLVEQVAAGSGASPEAFAARVEQLLGQLNLQLTTSKES